MNAPLPAMSWRLTADQTMALAVRSPDEIASVLRQAMTAMAEETKTAWLQVAASSNLRHSGAYVQGIQAAVIEDRGSTDSGDHLSFRFDITNNAPHAEIVENGHAAFRLPDRINWAGPKVKYGKKGPYLHIPMRHYTAQEAKDGPTMQALRNVMPEDVYSRARRLVARTPLNMGPQHNAAGQYVAADRYIQGGHLRMSNMANWIAGRHGLHESRRSERTVGRDASGRMLTNPEWKTPKHHGLFKTGVPGHTQYMTIRTITPTSKGWNIPAQPGHHVARTAMEKMAGPEGQRLFEAYISAFLESR